MKSVLLKNKNRPKKKTASACYNWAKKNNMHVFTHDLHNHENKNDKQKIFSNNFNQIQAFGRNPEASLSSVQITTEQRNREMPT